MNTETIDKLYLELSQFAQAKTARELVLKDTCDCLTDEISHLQAMLKTANDVLRSCHAVVERQITSPTPTNWESLLAVVKRTLEEQHKYFYPKPDERNA